MGTRAYSDEEIRERWAALQGRELVGEAYMEAARVKQYARRHGIELPRHRLRPARLVAGGRRGDLPYDEWLAAWEALPVPIFWSEEHNAWARLRRMAKRLGYTIPRRPNPGQERLRERKGEMRHRPSEAWDR